MLFWALRQVARWAMVGVTVALVYVNRDAIVAQFESLGGPPPPEVASVGPSGGARTLVIRANRLGHFAVKGEIEGAAVAFVVDTGASTVILSPEDAARAGIRPRDRDFTLVFRTANGSVRAAPVRLRELRIGPLRMENVDAAVNQAPIGVSLLGMSFLKRLDGFAVRDDKLELSW